MRIPSAARRNPLILSITLALTSPLALADDSRFTFKIENDGLASADDGHFTSGFELNYGYAPSPDSWTQRLAAALPEPIIGEADQAAFRLVHQIYTPNDIQQPQLIESDRPYAGLVFGGVSLYEDAPMTSNITRSTDLHLDVGLVGPSSLADSIQREVHHVTGSDRPRGWDNQLSDEPLLNLTLRRQWWVDTPLAGKQFAHGPSVGAALGNLYTYASAGYSVRWGDDASGVPTLTPNPGNRGQFDATRGWQWYLFASVDGYYMAHNLTLDGNVFSSSHSVDRKEWVGDASAGLALGWNDWQVNYAMLARSREFDGQQSHDAIGSITLTKRF
ncbi:lipid A deacylase LpxR family protein [Halomonas sp. PAMB 3264]|uniref:lipid A deacylase LpxR family protein n=1 Tax=unclassified Halomonas TaxID=2609666 RepID=UPI0028997C29|nr:MULTISPECIES: lipid A deacylase LpxR family protein [unclassified Halomonas]WNL38044.1 lipid A deacylase LpxR family protein [Halomonas sp. PAMB 3232]WNL41370.1 lipid A deacylase LpxR family protein [Halomonas sp. PAMB 3264]